MIGRELNPRIGSFDIKYWVELRPGIVAWVIFNIAMAVKQYQDLGDITAGMFLILLFQGWYCLDSFRNEVTTFPLDNIFDLLQGHTTLY